MEIILGIDPGSHITGYGVIELDDDHIKYVASGCIKASDNDFGQRLDQIYMGLKEVIEQYKPEQAAIEKVFVHRNAKAALKLGQARGVALVAVGHHHIPISEYSARKVKQSVVGYGAADKFQMQQMIRQLLHLDEAPQVDAADALAVAICHCHMRDTIGQYDMADDYNDYRDHG